MLSLVALSQSRWCKRICGLIFLLRSYNFLVDDFYLWTQSFIIKWYIFLKVLYMSLLILNCICEWFIRVYLHKSARSSYKMLMIHRFNLKSIMRNVQQYFKGVFYRFMALFCDNTFLRFRREVHYTHISPKGTLSV